jgi:hypothetical protein
MATVTKKYVDTLQQIGGVPYGNTTTLQYTFETNSSGVMVDSDQTTAVVQTNKVLLGRIPAGFKIMNLLSITSDAFSSSVTHKIGFEYCDGVDSTAVPQDDDYFFSALAISLGRTYMNNTGVVPVTLPKDAYLTLLVNGSSADHASAGRMDLLLMGVATGNP